MTKLRVEYFNRHIDIGLGNRGCVIVGDSGSGKSYFVRTLKNLQKTPFYVSYSTYPLEDIVIWNKKHEVDTSISNKLIIIDRFSLLRSDELDRFVKESDNKFILISHDYKFTRPEGFIELLLKFNKDTGNFDTRLVQLTNYFRITPGEEVLKELGW